MTELAFVDTETLGLDPDRHAIWEIALILATHDTEARELLFPQRFSWFVRLSDEQMAQADSTALRLTRFYARTIGVEWSQPQEIAKLVAVMTAERTLVGAVPDFDALRLGRMLRQHGQAPSWHYHLIDVETLVAGYLRGVASELGAAADVSDEGDHARDHAIDLAEIASPPWRSDDLLAAIDVEISEDQRHTAMGDADWAMRAYAEVYGLQLVEVDV